MINENNIIAAVRDEISFDLAINSKAKIIFHLSPDIENMQMLSKKAHNKNKKVFIHIDLTSGLGKDLSGIRYVKKADIDGIISTRANLIKLANECGLTTVQRVFIVDSHSIDTTMDLSKSAKPDMIEVMPGVSEKIIKILCSKTATPIIAGGLIDTKEEVKIALKSGAASISTSNQQLWEL